jgi:hypothetical protein
LHGNGGGNTCRCSSSFPQNEDNIQIIRLHHLLPPLCMTCITCLISCVMVDASERASRGPQSAEWTWAFITFVENVGICQPLELRDAMHAT